MSPCSGPRAQGELGGLLHAHHSSAMLYGMGYIARRATRTACEGATSTFKVCALGAAAIIIVPIVLRLAVVVGVIAIAVLLVVLAWRIGRNIDNRRRARDLDRHHAELAAWRLGHERRHMPTNPARHSNRR